MEEFVLKAEMRSDFGSKAARRLRNEGRLPANVYGHKEDNVAVTLDAREFLHFFEAGHRMAVIDVEGKQEHSVVKEVQYDGMGSHLLHVDFTRIGRDERIQMAVAIETFGAPKGLSGGGVLDVPHHELRLEGPARAIPEHIELNIEELGVGDSIRIRDIQAPEGCDVLGDPDDVVVIVHVPRGKAVGEGEEEAAPTEPEVIGRTADGESSEDAS